MAAVTTRSRQHTATPLRPQHERSLSAGQNILATTTTNIIMAAESPSRSTAGSALHWERKHQQQRRHQHRRSRSLQEWRQGAQIGACVAKDDDQELASRVLQLAAAVRQLETKLDDFKSGGGGGGGGGSVIINMIGGGAASSAAGGSSTWMGLEEKRHRKRLVAEIARTLDAKRKVLQEYQRHMLRVQHPSGAAEDDAELEIQVALTTTRSCNNIGTRPINSNSGGGEDGDEVEAVTRKLKSFLSLIRRRRERELCLDKYYYEDSNGSGGAGGGGGELQQQQHHDQVMRVQPNQEKSMPCLEVQYSDIQFTEGVLGHGCFSDVYEAHLHAPGVAAAADSSPVAVKLLRKGPLQRLTYMREVTALRRVLGASRRTPVQLGHQQQQHLQAASPLLQPPPVLRLRGYCAQPHACIVTELCAGACALLFLSSPSFLLTVVCGLADQQEAASNRFSVEE